MLRKTLYALALLALLILLLIFLPDGTAGAASPSTPQPVAVTNFPDLQRVKGEVKVAGGEVAVSGGQVAIAGGRVRVEGPVQQTDLGVRRATVGPTGGRAPGELVPAGTLSADGYGWVTLSLAGDVRGRGAGGTVGAVLVPDIDVAARAFDEGRLLLPLELEAPVEAAGGWVAASGERVALAFPRYRVYLFNTSERAVDARLYAYLAS